MNTCGYYSPYVTSSLTRGGVCRLQLLLVLASVVILRSDCRRTRDHILLSEIRRFLQPGGPGPHICIPLEPGGPVILPGTGFPFRLLLRLAELRWNYSTPPPHGVLPGTVYFRALIKPGFCIYIAAFILAWVVQWLKLVLSKGPNRVGVYSLNWGRKQIQFPKRYVL
jgi:hypothetical protein